MDAVGRFTSECGVPALTGLSVLKEGNTHVLQMLRERGVLLKVRMRVRVGVGVRVVPMVSLNCLSLLALSLVLSL